jgi:hypothetical protein
MNHDVSCSSSCNEVMIMKLGVDTSWIEQKRDKLLEERASIHLLFLMQLDH